MPSPKLTLVTGGTRSGKSRFAEELALSSGLPVIYVATMSATNDSELQGRITKHRRRRPSHWQTVEEPLLLAELVVKLSNNGGIEHLILIDCLSIFVSNLMLALPMGLDSEQIKEELLENIFQDCEEFFQAILASHGNRFVVVTNEVGSGIVPDNYLGRTFRDLLGEVNQRFAACADEVYACFSGIPLQLKGGESKML
jgi:adenosylcobinamide kinase/adenosylcobinamide-phosphate guanylyltransferase